MKEKQWTTVIQPKESFFKLKLNEVWEYRDLLFLFVKRDISATYKQTVLGPFWFFLSPLFTAAAYTFVFSSIAKLSTDQIPAPLFYLAGITCWNYFQSCFSGTSATFVANAAIFGKVYFPRLVSPLSVVISNLIRFSIQLAVLGVFIGYYSMIALVSPTWHLIFLPFLVVLMAGIGLGMGIIISSGTTKYRDLTYFISFGISLLMYITPIIYPISVIPVKFRFLVSLNPITPIIESFRYMCTGFGHFDFSGLCYSFVFMIILLTLGVLFFNRVERTFMDTV